MRRHLIGHAVSFNRRNKRLAISTKQIPIILCQEDRYLRELVRYIHINPPRARLLADIQGLGNYPFSDHGLVMGNMPDPGRMLKLCWRILAKPLRIFQD